MSPSNTQKAPRSNPTTENPIIIGHNCGYIGYAESIFPNDPPEVAEKKSIYSQEATSKAYQDCDYLEIDLVLKNKEKEWWYFHPGIKGACIKGEGNREDGIKFDDFLEHFNAAANEHKSQPEKPGIFLDLKEHLKQKKVDELMAYLNKKYADNDIPMGTPLMIFTGRGILPKIQTVYRDTTRFFLKWLVANDNQEPKILDPQYCPKLTIVTREVDIEKLVKGGIKATLEDKEKAWFDANLNKKVWWGFNPYTVWLAKYFKKYFKEKKYQIFKEGITIIPWFSNFIPWLSKLFADKWEDRDEGWIHVIGTILKNYWWYRSDCIKNENGLTTPKPASWGIITYKPNELKDCLRNLSFDDIK